MIAAAERRQRRVLVATWAIGLLAFAAVIVVVLRLSELEQMARLLRELRPRWFLAAFALQAATYVCAAAVWHVALARGGYEQSTRSLVPVALAMLFANQAVPTAGLSGSAIVLRALVLRGVPENFAMGTLLVGLVTTYAAYMLALAASVALMVSAHLVFRALLAVAGVFAAAALAIPAGILWYMRSASPRLRERASRVPLVGKALAALANAPTELLRDPLVLRRTVVLQLIELVLDAATLYVMLVAIGVPEKPSAAFASFTIAYAASSVGLTPLGLGTFEGACIGMLRLFGVGLEAALAATLLLRAFTLWLPMIPGFICARLVVTPSRV